MDRAHRDQTTMSAAPSVVEGRKARVRQLVAVAMPESAECETITLDARRLAIGRDSDPTGGRTLVLADPEASRTHAFVEHDASADAWFVVDNDSRNGVFVDGLRVPRAELQRGTVLRIGRSLLTLVDEELTHDDVLEPETADLLGRGLAMQLLRGRIAMVAPRAIQVLVLGETGVGKECVAREIHRRSGRSGALVAVNCAAIPEALAESELFGHAPGAFTGATQRTEGLFVAADGGTLFLDEVGELAPSVQAKLLRVLATGEVRAVGRAETRRVDVRVIAATHRPIAAGTDAFRDDLRARLSGWVLHVPPLRARREDILWLAGAFLRRARGGGLALSSSAAEALLRHDWQFNVRELEQVLAAAALRAERAGIVRLEHLPTPIASRVAAHGGAPAPPLSLLVPPDRTPSASDLRLVLEKLEGNLAHVAAYFGKDRRQVYRWLERAEIDPSAYRDE